MPTRKRMTTTKSSSALAIAAPSSAVVATSDVTVPGLIELTPDAIAQQLPAFEPSQYQIADPLNPGDLPQVTEGHHRRATKIYEGAARALDLVGQSMDLTKQKFEVVGKRAGAIESGLDAASQNEKTKQALLNLFTEAENTTQAGQKLSLAQYTSAIGAKELPILQGQLDERLEASRIKGELAAAKNERSQAELNEFRHELQQWRVIELEGVKA